MPRPTPIFATCPDFHAWLDDLVAAHRLAFTKAGMFDDPTIITFRELDAVPNLGTASTGNQLLEPSYLIHANDYNLTVRDIPQRNGGTRYSIDQRTNPECVGVCFGGQFGEHFVIAGQIGNGTDHPVSKQLHHVLLAQLKRTFTRIQSYWVGPRTAQMLDGGTRLTINHEAASEYDLVRPARKST